MEVVGRVIEQNRKIEGSSVELSDGSITLQGRVAAVSENEFLVEWEDGVRSVENKSDYELLFESREKTGSLPLSISQMGIPGKGLGVPMKRVDMTPSLMLPPIGLNNTMMIPNANGPTMPPAMPPAGIGGGAPNNMNNVLNNSSNSLTSVQNRLQTVWRSVENGLTRRREKRMSPPPAAPKSTNPSTPSSLEMPASPPAAAQAPASSGKL